MTTDIRGGALATAVVLLAFLVLFALATAPRLPAYARSVRGARPEPGDFTPTEYRRGRELRGRLRPLAYAGLGLRIALALVLGLTPAGSRVVKWSGALAGGSWEAQAALGVLALVLLTRVLGLPVDVAGERIAKDAGLSVQSWTSWFVDQLKALALGVGVSMILATGGYALVRGLPDTWWVVAAVLVAGLTMLLSFVFPLVIEPLFARFHPLEEGSLRDELHALAERDGVPVREVLVADASRRTTALNAYVSGFGRTRRVVVFDTLLNSASPAEVRLVVAHELGHAAERDVLTGTLLGAGGAAAGLMLAAAVVASPAMLRLADAGGVGDPRGLGLVLLVGTVLGLVGGPLMAALSRRIETRADLHSLDLTEDVDAFVRSERTLALVNRADLEPPRIAYLLFASHPSVPERIAFARRWAVAAGLRVPGPLADPTPLPAESR